MILDLFKLDGKVAVVTGANTGLGQGMAVALAQAGAKVLGVARRSCEDTKNKIEADGGVFAEVIADLSDMASIDVVMAEWIFLLIMRELLKDRMQLNSQRRIGIR